MPKRSKCTRRARCAAKRPCQPATSCRPLVSVTVECPVHESFRVAQVAGLFDVPLAAKSRETFNVELPTLAEPWDIGVIVGPSGSGKSTVARHAFDQALYQSDPAAWPGDRAVVDCFPEGQSIRDITQILSSVGFSTPPAWVKPYHVLSNGERFRCDLARALTAGGDLVVFDEFTSVVDRTVAKTGSVAVSKHVRRQNADGPRLRFVAVTCHYDIVEWLEPDWVLDMASRRLARGRLRRPPIEVKVYECSRSAWDLFKKTHYLSASLPAASNLYVGLVEGQPAGIVVVANQFGRRQRDTRYNGYRRIARVVVLPDFQGVGIAGRLMDAVAEMFAARNLRVGITSSHPSMIALLKRAKAWRITDVFRHGTAKKTFTAARAAQYRLGTRKIVGSQGRAVISAFYTGPGPGTPQAALKKR